jgi:ribosome-associated protein
MADIYVSGSLSIPSEAIDISYIRASGPGGQNVNKVATAAQLRFDAAASSRISSALFARLRGIAGRRMTGDGVIVITARRFRSQERNREDAIARLVDLLQQAARPPKARRPTRPGRAVKEKRLQSKKKRAQTKKHRSGPVDDG